MPASKRARLTDSPEFERVYRRGVAYRGKLLAVHAFPNEMGNARLGLSVSKKVGNAVLRNRTRRRLKAIFSNHLAKVPGDLDIVISARPSSGRATSEDLGEDFFKALKKFEEKKIRDLQGS